MTPIPRNSSGQYTLPPGTYGVANTTIASAKFNTFVDDLTQDLNTARPISAGGTNATSADDARSNLGGVSTEYLSDLFAGMVSFFPMASPPTGWLICNGQAVSRTTYATLFNRIGTTYGSGNGSTTFNVPELRGEFIRGLDLSRGVDSGRALGSAQSDANKAHTHTGTTNTTGAHSHTYTAASVSVGANIQSGSGYGNNGFLADTSSSGDHSHTVTINSSGGTEARPRNIAMVPCIKT